jgi:hypothetical protein
MSTKLARCPECGGDVTFRHKSSLLTVCSYCRSVLARTDVDPEKVGRVADLADVPSPLSLGMRGNAYGGFEVVGRLQLDHGAGTWNEWYLGLNNGKWLWLAEVQGRYYLTAPMGEATDAPLYPAARVGHTVHVPAPGQDSVVMRIVEVHRARVISAEGDLPWRIDLSEPVHYVDLAGPKKSFGTLDYGGAPDPVPHAYVGRQIDLGELELDQKTGPLRDDAPPRPTIKAARMECPQCHGALELKAPDISLRVVCPYCTALLDVSKEPLSALGTLNDSGRLLELNFPLGTTGEIQGRRYTVIGHMRREIDGTGFAWGEYILYLDKEDEGGRFHYLIEADGHYTLVRPIHVGDVHGYGFERSFGGRSYRHIETCEAVVTHLQGEFPWEVQDRERTQVEDYATPGYILSLERSLGEHEELVASAGEYLEATALYRAFGRTRAPIPTHYIAPHQPNPYAERLQRQKWPALVATTAVLVLMMIFSIRAHRYAGRAFYLKTVAGVEPAAEHIFLSEPFQLGDGGQGAVEVSLLAPALQDSWIGADISLINDEDGTAFSFGAEDSGYTDGESWTEGSRSAAVTVPAVHAGRYVLRVEPSWPAHRTCAWTADCPPLSTCELGKCKKLCTYRGECGAGQECVLPAEPPPGGVVAGRCAPAGVPYTVMLKYPANRPGWGLFVLGLILVVPLWNLIRRSQFEQRRKEDMEA